MKAKNLIFVLLFVTCVMGKPPSHLQKCEGNSVCTYFLHCENGKLNTDGSGIRDVRSPERTCSSYMDVCCDISNILPEVKPKSEPSAPAFEDDSPPKCGFRNKQGLGTQEDTVDENNAKFGEFPWTLVVLQKHLLFGRKKVLYACGASLIRPSVVLTAAHCVNKKDPNSLMIRAGEWNTHSKDEHFSYVDSDVESMIIHKDYVSKNDYNDVALLFLKTPLTKQDHISTICLPPQDMEFDNASCFVNSWGRRDMNIGSKYSEILKNVEIPMMSHDVCEKRLRDTRLGKRFNLHYSFICGGGEEGADTCTGDGGSALVCPIDGLDGYYYQAGIVSWGIGCERGNPGVYVKVSQFSNWIDEQIAAKHATDE